MQYVQDANRTVYTVQLNSHDYKAYLMGLGMRRQHELGKMHRVNPFDKRSFPREFCCLELGWHHEHLVRDEQEIRQTCLAYSLQEPAKKSKEIAEFYEGLVRATNCTLLVTKV